MHQSSISFSVDLNEFFSHLNSLRTTFKKKAFSRDRVGEMIAQEVLSSGSNGQDQLYQQILSKYSVASVSQPEYFVYEMSQMPRGYSYTQQEVIENFKKALDDMINLAYKGKLLIGNIYSHVGFAYIQTGNKSDVFKIAVFGSQKKINIDGIIYCNSQQDSGLILAGKVLDMSIKPEILVINRGNSQAQLVVGPNRMQYSHETGEYRIQVPDVYNGIPIIQAMQSCIDQGVIFELFISNSQNNSFNYGQGQDYPNTFDQFYSLELGVSDLITDMNMIEQRPITMSAAFQQVQLFDNNYRQNTQNTGLQKTSQIRPSTNAPIVRTTKAQLMRQQTALQKQSQGSSMSNLAQGVNMNQLKTPTFNRSQTMNPAFQTRTSLPFNSQSNTNFGQNLPLNKMNLNPNFIKNENTNPNLVSFNNSKSQAFTISVGNNNQNNNGFQKPQLSQQNQLQSQNGNNNNFNSNQNNNFANQGQTNGFNKPINFTFNSQNNQNQVRPAQNGFQFSTNNQNFNQQQPPPFQPQQTLNFQPRFNPPQQNQQTPFNTNNNFLPTYNSSTQIRPQQIQQQQPFVIQPTIRVGSQMRTQQQQQPQVMAQNPIFNNQSQVPPILQQKQHMVFSQLSLIDQETLKGYLKELSEVLNEEQIQKVTALMLTDPTQFYQYFLAAHQQFQQQSCGLTSSKSLQQNIQIQQKQDSVKNEPTKLQDYDDLTLFLLSIPKDLIKNHEVKYEFMLQQLKDNQLSSQKLVKKLLIRKKCPKNDSFKKMLDSKQHTDLILCHRNEEYLCHKIVFSSMSDFFKKAIKESETINKYQYGNDTKTMQKFVIPEWMDQTALKLFIYFMYTGEIGKDDDFTQLSTKDLFNLLKIGNFFFLDSLQESLIAKILIPHMTHSSAAVFTKECSLKDKNHKDSCLNAWAFLKQYSMFFLQKHLPALIRTAPQLLYELDSCTLKNLIQKALFYIVDGVKDIECVLQFTADAWADKSITKLFKDSQASLESCSAFDFQVIPQMPDFLKQIDPTLDYSCQLIKGDNQGKLFKSADSEEVSHDTKQGSANPLDSTFIQSKTSQETQQQTKSSEPKTDLSKWSPANNVLKFVSDEKEFFDLKDPTFQTQIDMTKIKAEYERNQKGVSVITKAFDFGRRSWSLKIDIDSDQNISIFVIERGSPLNRHSSDPCSVGLNLPYKFSSVLVRFELTDLAVGDFSSMLFYTFAHDSHQVVGHQQFINLGQLKDKDTISVKVNMKEFIMHSALCQHISQHFGELYTRDLSKIDSLKKQQQTYQQPIVYDMLDMPFYSVFQIMLSSYLKINNENSVLGFIFHFTQHLQIAYPSKNHQCQIATLLSYSLRFYYLSSKKIFSALRDNESLRGSEVFVSKCRQEIQERITQSQTQIVVNLGTSNSSKRLNPRRYYDPSLVSSDGRRKPDSQDKPSLFIDELMDWLQHSKHNKDNTSLLFNEVKKWQALYYEERSKYLKAINSQVIQQRVLSPARRNRRSFSGDRVFEKPQQEKNQVPGFLRYRSPQKQLPQNPTLQRQQTGAVVNARLRHNNSFDSRFNESVRGVYNYNSTIVADGKLRSNQNLDFSLLLSEINRSSKKENQYNPYYNQQQQNAQQYQSKSLVPYYRQKEQSQSQNECSIF